MGVVLPLSAGGNITQIGATRESQDGRFRCKQLADRAFAVETNPHKTVFGFPESCPFKAMNYPLTKQLTALWLAAVIVLVVATIGATIPMHRHEIQRVEAIRADIRLIDAAASQLAQR